MQPPHPRHKAQCNTCGGAPTGFEIETCSRCHSIQHTHCMPLFPETILQYWICEECQPENGESSPKYCKERVFIGLGRKVPAKKQKAVPAGKVKYLSIEEVKMMSSGAPKREFASQSNSGLRPAPPNPITSPSRKTPGFKNFGQNFKPANQKPNPGFACSGSTGWPANHGTKQSSSLISQQADKRAVDSQGLREKACENPSKIIRCDKEPESSSRFGKQKKVRDINVVYAAEKAMMASSTSMPRSIVISEDVEESSHASPGEDARGVDRLLPANDLGILDISGENMRRSSSSSPSGVLQNAAGGNFYAAGKPESSFVDKREKEEIGLNFSISRPYLPALYATWRGGFKFIDTAIPAESCFCFKAQPPSRVDCRAYELSQKMPAVLQVKLTPRCHLRADLFQHGCPDLHDLALYFFPVDSSERYKLDYSDIFELMDLRNSVITTCIGDVELLIFTSKQLRIDPWDVCGGSNSNFLGGVFCHLKYHQIPQKSRQKVSLLVTPEYVCDNYADMDNGEAVDMEIDMIGGRTVGSSDLVVHRVSTGNVSGSSGNVTAHEVAMQTMDVKNSRVMGDLIDTPVLQASDQEQCGESTTLPPCFVGMNTKPEIQSKGNDEEKPTETRGQKRQGDGLHLGDVTSPTSVSSNVAWTVKVKTEEIEFGNDGLSSSHKLRTPSPSKIEKPSCWQAPPLSWVKLNIAGSLLREKASSTGAGGLVRDDSGKWVVGYNIRLETCKTLEAELRALLVGTTLLWDRGYRKIIVEFTSFPAMICLESAPLPSNPDRGLIENCRDLISRRWDCKIHHIQRCQNSCADWLTSHPESNALGVQVFEIPPLELVPFLQKDCSSFGS